MSALLQEAAGDASADAGADAAINRFAASLIAQISAHDLHLAAWSKDCEQVLAELARPKPSTLRLAQLVAMDVRLAVLTLGVAQSPLFGSLASSGLDLQLIIATLGTARLRAIALAAGIAQLPAAPRLQALRSEVQEFGERGIAVAAICMQLAARTGRLDVTDAFLLGLTHNIGKFWLYANLRAAGDWHQDAARRRYLLSRWQAQVGAAALRSWALPDWLADAVANQEELGRDAADAAGGELLAAAVLAAGGSNEPAATATHLAEFSRVGLSAEDWLALLRGVPATTDALRVLLRS
jgi:HD-like signal output (HDOD) protein